MYTDTHLIKSKPGYLGSFWVRKTALRPKDRRSDSRSAPALLLSPERYSITHTEDFVRWNPSRRGELESRDQIRQDVSARMPAHTECFLQVII